VSPKSSPRRNVKPLPSWQRRSIYALGLTLLLSGILWLILHHYFLLDGEFGPEHRPLEHTLLVIHGSAAMPMIWLIGVIWTAHIRRGWRERRSLPRCCTTPPLIAYAPSPASRIG
jgi:hypothetical protein